MLTNLKDVKAIAPYFAELPSNKYYPKLGGLLKRIVYPDVTDMVFNLRSGNSAQAGGGVISDTRHIDLATNDSELMGLGLYNMAQIKNNEELRELAVQRLTEDTQSSLHDIEQVIIPAIKTAEEFLVQLRHQVPKPKHIQLMRMVLPNMLSGIKGEALIAELDVNTTIVKTYNYRGLTMTRESFAELIASGLDKQVKDLYTLMPLDKLADYWNVRVTGGKPSTNMYETITGELFIWLMVNALIANPPEKLSMPGAEWTKSLHNLRRHSASVIVYTYNRIKLNTDRLIVGYDKDTKIVQVDDKLFQEYSQSLEGTLSAEDSVRGFVAGRNANTVVLQGTLKAIKDNQETSIKHLKDIEVLHDNKYRSDIVSHVRELYKAVIRAAYHDIEDYSEKVSIDEAYAVAKDMFKRASTEELLDSANNFPVKLITRAIFPTSPAEGYILEMLRQEKIHGHGVDRRDLVKFALIELLGKTLAQAFSR